jgi:nucleoporin NUP1
MASSSSPSSQRRRPLKKRQPLSRSNSSLFGTIRNIVTAPLTWFASTDDFEDSKILKGKRRRVVAPQNGLFGEHDSYLTPHKRMRVHSPPKDHQQFHLSPSGHSFGYLDPPTSVFQQQHNQPNFFNQSITSPSASVSIPVPAMQAYEPFRNNNTLIRGSTLSRTMSIDPPSRPVSRSSAVVPNLVPLNLDNSTETLMTHPTRDLSMPPLSARPSFRMRTSMTPQPRSQKETSDPPSLNMLVANPMFIRGPTAHISEHHTPSITLGSLVESVRSVRVSVLFQVRQLTFFHRRHTLQSANIVLCSSDPASRTQRVSAFLFPQVLSHPSSITTSSVRQESPAEKALHELDVYKTPLLPTRLRSNISRSFADSASTDLFKFHRRKSNLVLMQDNERVSRFGPKLNVKRDVMLVNETKPYAGEGGMKKLLARRRREVEKYEQKTDVCEGGDVEEREVQDTHSTPTPNNRLDVLCMSLDSTQPSHPSKGWHSTSSLSSASASPSSLRVGRTKTRAHIARPMKTKFSAAYEDDSLDDVEVLQGETEKQAEREVLDEAAKPIPVFQIHEGFSFANEVCF